MKSVKPKTLSTVTTTDTAVTTRTSRQSLLILSFIHRFRHVTSRHIQLLLGHSSISTSFRQLSLLCAKGYIARQYGPRERAASYYLTLEGLTLLSKHNMGKKYRHPRSVRIDAAMGIRQRERYHILADVYTHFKRHYDGHFEFFTAFDIAGLDNIPDEIPDGYVRTTLPDTGTQHYFIEIYGWNRSTQIQKRRIFSYLQFTESGHWQTMTNESFPKLFIVAASQVIQRRLTAQMSKSLEECLANNLFIFTTAAAKLDSSESAIWRQVH